MWCKISLWMLVLSFAVQGRAQTGLILASALNDPAVKAQDQWIGQIQHVSPRLPWLDQWGVRTETDRFELARQQYATRFNFNGLAEKKYYRRWVRTHGEAAKADQAESLLDAIGERYSALIQYHSARQALALQQQLVLVYRDQRSFYQQLSAAQANARLNDLLKSEQDMEDAQLNIARLERDITQLEQQFSTWTGHVAPVIPDTAGWISPDRIVALAVAMGDSMLPSPDMLQLVAKKAQIEAERRLEQARSRQILDFIQLQYRDRLEEPFRNDASVSMGFTLPYNGSRQAKKRLLDIERFRVEQQYSELQERIKNEASGKLNALQLQYRQYQQAAQQLSDAVQRYETTRFSTLGADGIEAQLLLQELLLKRKLKIAFHLEEMQKTYLDILQITGKSAQKPYINFLSENNLTW